MEKNKTGVQKKEGRKKRKDNPSVYRYSVNLNEIENIEFQTLMKQSGIKSISKYISACLFEKEVKVITVDKHTKDYYMQLTNLYADFQKIGVNYNQAVKALHTNFGEKRARALVYNLQKATLELIVIHNEILKLTKELMQK